MAIKPGQTARQPYEKPRVDSSQSASSTQLPPIYVGMEMVQPGRPMSPDRESGGEPVPGPLVEESQGSVQNVTGRRQAAAFPAPSCSQLAAQP